MVVNVPIIMQVTVLQYSQLRLVRHQINSSLRLIWTNPIYTTPLTAHVK